MTGDQADIADRLKRLLPRWFGQDEAETPVLDALLQGPAWALSFVYDLWAYAKLQTRLLTATGAWLDLWAADFFGTTLTRTQNQTDTSFRSRIIANLLRERGTRRAVVKVLQDLTGRTPSVFEFLNPADTGGYNLGGVGYGVAGGYGTFAMPFEAFVTAYRPMTSGIPLVAGYGVSTGGYNQASRADYASLADVLGAVTDADIYAAIDGVRPAGTTLWVEILS